MAMMGGRRGGEEPTRDDQSGDENKENNAQLTPLVSSESLSVGSNWMGAKNDGKGPEGDTLIVSDVLLLWLWLERRLESEVQKENFEEAATLKREMKRLRVKALSMLEGKIHKAAEVMRAETSKKRRDALQRIQMDLDHALVEEVSFSSSNESTPLLKAFLCSRQNFS